MIVFDLMNMGERSQGGNKKGSDDYVVFRKKS